MKLSDLANKLNCRVDSTAPADTDIEITGVAGLEQAQPGQIAFLANKRYTPLLKTTCASAVFVDENVSVARDPGQAQLALVRSSNPYLAFARAHRTFLSTTSLHAGHSSHRRRCLVGKDRRQRPHRPALFRGRKCGDRQERHPAQRCFHLPWRAHWRRFLRAFARGRPRILPPWQSRHSPKRCRDRSRRPRLRQTSRTAPGTRLFSPARPYSKMMSKSRPTPASIAPPSAKRASATVLKSMTLF